MSEQPRVYDPLSVAQATIANLLGTVSSLRAENAVLKARCAELESSPVVSIPSAGMSPEQLAALGFGTDGAPR